MSRLALMAIIRVIALPCATIVLEMCYGRLPKGGKNRGSGIEGEERGDLELARIGSAALLKRQGLGKRIYDLDELVQLEFGHFVHDLQRICNALIQ